MITGTVSPFDLSTAQSKMQSDQASLRAEQSNLSGLSEIQNYLVVHAPFTGVITERNIHPGALVGPSTKPIDGPLLSLQQLNKLRLVVNVPQSVSANINPKEEVTYTIDAFPDKEFKAKIARQSGIINSNVRSEAIEFDIPSKNGEIKPGMYAEVIFPVNSTGNSFVVPASAIVHSTRGVYLVSVDNQNKITFIPIQEGMSNKNNTQVYGQLTDGLKIMLHPSTETEEGSLVK